MASHAQHLTTSVTFLPNVALPNYLIQLSKLKIQDESIARKKIYQICTAYPDLKRVISLLHPEDKETPLRELISRYNVEHFLELIFSSILNKKLYGNYLKHPDLTHVITIEKYCQEIRPHGFGPGPRLMLLFLYLRLASHELKNAPTDFYTESFMHSIRPFIEKVNTSTYEIDWMLLLVKLLSDALGEYQLHTCIDQQLSFSSIIKTFQKKEQNALIQSLINYANSINEDYFLYQDFI